MRLSLAVDFVEAPVATVKALLFDWSSWFRGGGGGDQKRNGFSFDYPCTWEVDNQGPEFAKTEVGFSVDEAQDELTLRGFLCLF